MNRRLLLVKNLFILYGLTQEYLPRLMFPRYLAQMEVWVIDFTEESEARSWFKEQGRDVSVALTARNALRAIPFITIPSSIENEHVLSLILTAFRCLRMAFVNPADDAREQAFARAAKNAYSKSAEFQNQNSARHAVLVKAVAAFTIAAGIFDLYADAAYAAFVNAALVSEGLSIAFARDASEIEQGGLSAEDLAASPLWTNASGERLDDRFLTDILSRWQNLKAHLLAQNQD